MKTIPSPLLSNSRSHSRISRIFINYGITLLVTKVCAYPRFAYVSSRISGWLIFEHMAAEFTVSRKDTAKNFFPFLYLLGGWSDASIADN